jgi:hypothetical protein
MYIFNQLKLHPSVFAIYLDIYDITTTTLQKATVPSKQAADIDPKSSLANLLYLIIIAVSDI